MSERRRLMGEVMTPFDEQILRAKKGVADKGFAAWTNQNMLDVLATLDKERERIAELEADLNEEHEHNERLEKKLRDWGAGCSCGYDNEGDVCAVHHPRIQQAEYERDKLRKACQAMVAVFEKHEEDRAVDNWDKDAREAYRLGQEALND